MFTSLLGNTKVSNFASSKLDTTKYCCNGGLRLDAPPAVPEPVTWGMMLAGVVGFELHCKN